jgi:glucoamylase
MPLVWAHAEFIKLMVSRHLGHPVDRPRAVWRRYRGRRPTARHAFWWLHAPIREFHAGARLAVPLPRAAIVHWGESDWRNAADEPTRDSGLGFHVASLDATRLPPGEHVEFTWQSQDDGAWHGRDYQVSVSPADAE